MHFSSGIFEKQNNCYEGDSMVAMVLRFAVLILVCLLPLNSFALIGLNEGDAPKKILLEDMNGNGVNVTAFFGKQPVIIVFWELTIDESFINYSLDELLFLSERYEEYKNKYGLEIFAIYTPEEQQNIPENEIKRVRNLIKMNKIKFPVLIDRGFRAFRDYGVIALPTAIMVGKTGKVRFIYPSFPVTARPVFDEKIRELLGLVTLHKEKEREKDEIATQSVRLYNYSLQMFKKGLLEQSLSPLNKSLELDSSSAEAHNLMGIILREKGDFDGAVKEFHVAMGLDGKNVHPRFNYGLLLLEKEQYVEAEEMLRKSIDLENDLAEAHYALGVLYKNTGKTNSAINEMNRAFELFDRSKSDHAYEINNATVLNRISTLYILSELLKGQGNTQQSLKLLHKATEIALGLDSGNAEERRHISKELLIYE